MHELANEGGIPTPVTVRPETTQAALRFASEAGYPVVMKAANPFVPARPPTALVRDQDQLLQHLTRLGAHGQPLNIVLQEHIPGAVDCVWMCNGYFGADPARSVTFTGTKLRQVSPTGVASLAVCRPNDTVARQTRDFLHRIGYRGCVGIGWRYDARDGRYKLLDVNARVSGVFRLFAGTNEMDVVRICYLDLTGQPIPPTSLQPGRKWMLEDDVLAAAGAIRNGSLTIRGWTASMRGVRELHWLAADDPRPFLGWARGRAARAAQEAGARFGPRSDVRS
jgi:predicted ATP-grasp superfamily ATP-dependent carboligase